MSAGRLTIEFVVEGLPPKKDGATSMWGKPGEAEKVRALRLSAAEAFGDNPPLRSDIRLTLRAHIGTVNARHIGDLDNYITGICDALQSAEDRAKIAIDFEPHIAPSKPIAFTDDVEIVEILASKVVAPVEKPFYEVVLEGQQ